MTWTMGEMPERFPHSLRLLGWDGLGLVYRSPAAVKLYRTRQAAGERWVGSGNQLRYAVEDVRVAVVRQLLMDALQMPRALPRVLDDAIRHAEWKSTVVLRLGGVWVSLWVPLPVWRELAS